MADDKDKKRSRDRDVLRPKHPSPPAGTPTWSEDTAQHHIQPSGSGTDDDTPVGLDTLDAEAEFRLRNRVKETNQNVKSVKVATEETHAGVSALRTEMTDHVTRLDQSLGRTNAKLDETNAQVGALRTETNSKLNELGGLVIESTKSVNNAVAQLNEFQGVVIENQFQRQRVSYEAHAKVDTNQKILEQKDQADATQQARSFRYKVWQTVLKWLAAAGVVGATAIATHFAERC